MADANADITIEAPLNYAMLNGYAKSINSTITSISWRQIGGPTAHISNSNSLQSKVSGLDLIGVYEFELSVSDNAGHFDKDTMILKVENASSANNQIFLWDVKWTQNDTGFDELHIQIDNFYYFVPINAPFEIFIRRDASSAWEEVIPSTQSSGNPGYVYYLGNNLNAGLTIYELPEVSTNDKPDIKMIF